VRQATLWPSCHVARVADMPSRPGSPHVVLPQIPALPCSVGIDARATAEQTMAKLAASDTRSCAADDRLASWQAQWDEKKLGWHMAEINPVLANNFKELFHQDISGQRILFPLCGKTIDMAFLARSGYRVVGVDGVEAAIYEFAAEQSSTGIPSHLDLPEGVDGARFKGYTVVPSSPEGQQPGVTPQPVTLIKGDFLSIGKKDAESLVPFNAAFDRGSLVAVRPADRFQYMTTLSHLIAPGGKVLLQVFEHDPFEDGRLGPPFEVTEAQLRELCAGKFDVRPLSRRDALDDIPYMREVGVTYFTECVYLLQRLAPAV